jgi:hypothetical protein
MPISVGRIASLTANHIPPTFSNARLPETNTLTVPSTDRKFVFLRFAKSYAPYPMGRINAATIPHIGPSHRSVLNFISTIVGTIRLQKRFSSRFSCLVEFDTAWKRGEQAAKQGALANHFPRFLVRRFVSLLPFP